ncbi:MAG: hypothetical protein ACD_77C00115G0001, partial [uncultured bacterium]
MPEKTYTFFELFSPSNVNLSGMPASALFLPAPNTL